MWVHINFVTISSVKSLVRSESYTIKPNSALVSRIIPARHCRQRLGTEVSKILSACFGIKPHGFVFRENYQDTPKVLLTNWVMIYLLVVTQLVIATLECNCFMTRKHVSLEVMMIQENLISFFNLVLNLVLEVIPP